MSLTKLNVAILGCGNQAHRHAQVFAKLDKDVQLVAVCDRNKVRADAFAQQYQLTRAKTYTDHHAMLDDAAIDLLVVSLPPFAHIDEVELAAERGIHLLLEKPIALSSEKAWNMVGAAESAGIKTQVGFNYRFGEAVEQLKTKIISGESGPVGMMSARYFCNALHAEWWRDRSRSGGQVVEQVIHMFDLLRYLVGEPVRVYSRQDNLFHQDMPDYSIEDVSATVITFESGALGVVYATNGAIPGKWINDYRVVAQRITADFADANHAVFYNTGDANRPPDTIGSNRDFRLYQTQDLLDAIRFGTETRTPIREGAKSLDLVLAAVQSAESGKEVKT